MGEWRYSSKKVIFSFLKLNFVIRVLSSGIGCCVVRCSSNLKMKETYSSKKSVDF
jgi:hypothetical protein